MWIYRIKFSREFGFQRTSVVIINHLSRGRKESVELAAIKIITADINNQEELESIILDVDGCFHLAAIASVVSRF